MSISKSIYIGPYFECIPYMEMKYKDILCCPQDCKGEMKGDFCHSCGVQLITQSIEIGEGASIRSVGLMDELRDRENITKVLDYKENDFWISNKKYHDREDYFHCDSEGVLANFPIPAPKRSGGDGVGWEIRIFKEQYKEDMASLIQCYEGVEVNWGVIFWMS